MWAHVGVARQTLLQWSTMNFLLLICICSQFLQNIERSATEVYGEPAVCMYMIACSVAGSNLLSRTRSRDSCGPKRTSPPVLCSIAAVIRSPSADLKLVRGRKHLGPPSAELAAAPSLVRLLPMQHKGCCAEEGCRKKGLFQQARIPSSVLPKVSPPTLV